MACTICNKPILCESVSEKITDGKFIIGIAHSNCFILSTNGLDNT